MEKSEKFLKLEKSVKATQNKRDICSSELLTYVSSVVQHNLEEALEELRPQIEKGHKIKPENTDKKINAVHYTSIEAFVCMIQNTLKDNKHSLRLYDSMHLNDPEEGKYLVRNLIKKTQLARNRRTDALVHRLFYYSRKRQSK